MGGIAPLPHPPTGYAPGGNRILIAGYRPVQEFVTERSSCAHQGRSQDFSKGGGGWNYGSKSYEKEKLLVIRIARKAHILWINSSLYSPRNLGSLQLNCHLVSLIFFHDDRKTQPPWLHVSAEFCFDLWFFSTVGKHISHVHVFFIFAKFKKRIKLLCAKLVVLTCLMRL